jgi:hypothetical protein
MQIFNCDALTGGAARAVDYQSKDDLSNKDRSIAIIAGKRLDFEYNSTSTDAENVTTHPYKIRPDDYVDGGVWEEIPFLKDGDAINMADALLTRPVIKDYAETPQSPSSTSTTVLDVEDGNVISFTLTEATTISTSNILADLAGSLTIVITAAAGSEYAITWPATWKWAGGAAPATFAVSTEHIVTLMWTDGDDTAKFYASYVGAFATA